MSRLRRFAWIASWIVVACLSSVVPSHAQKGSPTPEASPGPDPTPTRTEGPKSRCEKYVDVLSGKKKDDDVLADPNAKELAARSFDLIACRAVATDSDAPCALVPVQKDECRLIRQTLHELRTNPTGRSYTFPDVKYETCRADAKFKPTCDALRAAALSGNPNDCAGAGDQEPYCRASLTLDESYCAKYVEPNGCKKVIEANRVFAKGLKSLAESGPPREQAFAKAALGDAEACTRFALDAMTACGSQPAVPTKSPAAESTTAPAAPQKE